MHVNAFIGIPYISLLCLRGAREKLRQLAQGNEPVFSEILRARSENEL